MGLRALAGPLLVALAALCPCLAGCGEIAFKRGSGSDDFSAARQHCRQQSQDEAAYSDCLAKGGWSFADLNASVKVDQASPAVPAPVPGMSPAPSVASGIASTSTSFQPPASESPRDVISVGSWWKAGGDRAALQASVNECVTLLGPDNRPDAAYRRVTRALYLCLTKRGWHVLGRAG
jgi:hypothetical protein